MFSLLRSGEVSLRLRRLDPEDLAEPLFGLAVSAMVCLSSYEKACLPGLWVGKGEAGHGALSGAAVARAVASAHETTTSYDWCGRVVRGVAVFPDAKRVQASSSVVVARRP